MRIAKAEEPEIHGEHQLLLPRDSSRAGKLLRYIRYTRRHYPAAKDFELSLQSAFARAAEEVPSIEMHRGILGGTPCLKGTRIPVYMILDAIEYSGTLRGAAKSYPHLRTEQIKDAVRFAKLVAESPVDHKVALTSR